MQIQKKTIRLFLFKKRYLPRRLLVTFIKKSFFFPLKLSRKCIDTAQVKKESRKERKAYF